MFIAGILKEKLFCCRYHHVSLLLLQFLEGFSPLWTQTLAIPLSLLANRHSHPSGISPFTFQ